MPKLAEAMWDNRSAPGGATNTLRGLTHSLDLGKEGLAMKATRCSIEGCGNPGRLRRGWCEMHYCRWRTTGDPLKTKRVPGEVRFWSKVAPTGFCWLYEGPLQGNGYGAISVDGARIPAHRYAYELLVGPIPDGLVLDHLCRVVTCVNPDHLEPVTQRENLQRAARAMGLDLRCKNGHAREGNTRIDSQGRTECIPCRQENTRRQTAKRSAIKRTRQLAALPPERGQE